MEKAGESSLSRRGKKLDGSRGGKVAGKDQEKELVVVPTCGMRFFKTFF